MMKLIGCFSCGNVKQDDDGVAANQRYIKKNALQVCGFRDFSTPFGPSGAGYVFKNTSGDEVGMMRWNAQSGKMDQTWKEPRLQPPQKVIKYWQNAYGKSTGEFPNIPTEAYRRK